MKKSKVTSTGQEDIKGMEEQPLDKTMEVNTESKERNLKQEDRENIKDPDTDSKTNELSEKDEIIDKLNQELDKTKESVLRKVAEYDNLKKRLQKEKSQIFQDSKIAALESFLPIRDDLKRSLEASEKVELDKNFLEGIQMVAGKFEKVLENLGVKPIDEEMVPFDVDIHDALLRQPAENDKVESNTVLKIIEPGYKIENRVIKHAKVIVSQ